MKPTSPPSSPITSPILLSLPPRALHWSVAASTAAAISYADRGTSAIAASSLLDELHWSESQLGHVQSAFFVGYALTQVFGGLLGGGHRSSSSSNIPSFAEGSTGGTLFSDNAAISHRASRDFELGKLLIDDDDGDDTRTNNIQRQRPQQQNDGGGYRTILPISLVLTGITTLLFPIAAKAGPQYAILDRFTLGLLEGVLLPAAMAGVGATTSATTATGASGAPSIALDETTTTTTTTTVTSARKKKWNNTENIKATASAIVIAGCYLGSAWAYLSAWIIFSDESILSSSRLYYHLAQWGLLQYYQESSLSTSPSVDVVSVWPLLFYINGIISLLIPIMFSNEFDMDIGWRKSNNIITAKNKYGNLLSSSSSSSRSSSSIMMTMMKEANAIAKETLSSRSGRAIVAAQIGQGALLYSVSSWGPLYLERIADASTAAAAIETTEVLQSSSLLSSTAVAASIAASSLILPQLTQALIGVSIGVGADKLSSSIGPRLTRRCLQCMSGVGPAMILFYLSILRNVNIGEGGDGNTTLLLSPAFLFGAAQTISALSLGAVSVSHLEVATPSKSGAVYALGNVFAAISGSITVTLFGILLDKDSGHQAATTAAAVSDFSLPFQIVAMLSAAGSLFYSWTIESELEIGMEGKRHDQ